MLRFVRGTSASADNRRHHSHAICPHQPLLKHPPNPRVLQRTIAILALPAAHLARAIVRSRASPAERSRRRHRQRRHEQPLQRLPSQARRAPMLAMEKRAERAVQLLVAASTALGAAQRAAMQPSRMLAGKRGCANVAANCEQFARAIRCFIADCVLSARLCSVYYCGSDCQARDWERHRELCIQRK